MDPAAYEYLGFEWQGKFYVFKVLPFGLSTAPWAFSKVMRVVVGFLRSKGVKLIPYLDDFLFFIRPILTTATATRTFVLRTFSEAGFTINDAKSQLTFTTTIEHLGFGVDTVQGTFTIPPARWSALQALLK
jgi:hypothetical protein